MRANDNRNREFIVEDLLSMITVSCYNCCFFPSLIFFFHPHVNEQKDKSGSLKVKEVSSELEAEALVAENAAVVAQDAANAAAARIGGDDRKNDEVDRKTSLASEIIEANTAEMMRPNYF